MFFVNVSIDSDFLMEDLIILSFVLKKKKENNFVCINVFLIDKKDEGFIIIYSLVGVMMMIIVNVLCSIYVFVVFIIFIRFFIRYKVIKFVLVVL